MATVSKDVRIPGEFTLQAGTFVGLSQNADQVWATGSLKDHANEGDCVAMEIGSMTRYAQLYVVEKEFFTALPAYSGSSDATGVIVYSGSYSE